MEHPSAPKNNDIASHWAEDAWIEMDTRRSSPFTIDYNSELPIRASSPAQSVSSVSSSQTLGVSSRSRGIFRAWWRSSSRSFQLLSSWFPNWVRTTPLYGWRFGVFLGCCSTTAVLFANIAIVIFGATSDTGFQDGISAIARDSTESISRKNTALHILINGLSTILLSASNYTMQVLCSPTREEVDKRHAQGEWLDIGSLSFRNLRYISGRRRVLWLVLLLSSMPLHLFYNSAIFEVITGNQYSARFVEYLSDDWHALNTSSKGVFSNFTNQQWHNAYTKSPYVSGYGDLHIVLDKISMDLGLFQNESIRTDLPSFPCQIFQNVTVNSSSADLQLHPGIIKSKKLGWWVFVSELPGDAIYTSAVQIHIRHAFAKRVEGSSRINISLYFMLIVIVCNTLKAITMLVVVLDSREIYLVTAGDAIASFLEHEDRTTTGVCLFGREELLAQGELDQTSKRSNQENSQLRRRIEGIWDTRKINYGSVSGSWLRWTRGWFSPTLLFLSIILPVFTSRNPGWGAASSAILPFSKTSPDAKGTLFNAWLANVAQLLLSIFYVTFNGACTAMAAAQEWNSFGVTRKALRVTKPEGEQRSTHFLQLPFRWAIPFAVSSSILHWLLSETLFLVRIDVQDANGNLIPEYSKSACGISFMSLGALMIVFSLMVCGLDGLGFVHFEVKVPVAASCSLAISAACHPPKDEVDPQLCRLRWGVVEITEETDYNDGLQHCSFSSRAVKKPKAGERYA